MNQLNENGRRTGYWKSYFVVNGCINFIDYNGSGDVISVKGSYIDGERIGLWQFYNIESKLIRQEYYA